MAASPEGPDGLAPPSGSGRAILETPLVSTRMIVRCPPGRASAMFGSARGQGPCPPSPKEAPMRYEKVVVVAALLALTTSPDMTQIPANDEFQITKSDEL